MTPSPSDILDSWAATHRAASVPALRKALAAAPDRWGPRILAMAGVVEPSRPGVPDPPAGPTPADAWVAPLGGIAPASPGTYRVTATFPHLETPDQAEVIVELLKLQDERPYILIVDTGSTAPVRDRLEQLRGEGVEIHYLRAHRWEHPSESIAAACELAQIICHTDHLYFTHSDCFPVRRDLISSLAARCTAANPSVGYRITDRSHAEICRLTGADPATTPPHPTTTNDDCRWIAGHTCLMVHRPTINRAGVRWAFRWGEDAGVKPVPWIDTEAYFNYSLRAAGLVTDLIGDEANYARNLNADFDHVRSFASTRVYSWAGPSDEWREQVKRWMDEAMGQARARIVEWRRAGKVRGDLGRTIRAKGT